MLKPIKILLLLLMTLSSFTCASTETDDVKLDKAQVDVVLREWNKKGFGDKIETTTLTIITAPDYKGDIVILRENEPKRGFTAEVYKPKPNALNPELWEFVSGDIEKSIVKQPNGKFHLSEMVDKGVRIEVIELDKEEQ
ncbi:hypothetical protein [Microbulbifer sp. PAAF003]|uniref:hypothetical protein n=1 Tax=Microbulbifer sp. PAAF003 TaxID=3243375 RepID=UPI00403A6086